MKKHLITFADKNFKQASFRLKIEASKLNYFKNIAVYDPTDLTMELKKTGLLQYKRGYGLWSWKPEIILNEMTLIEENDYIIYLDAGCFVYKHKEWDLLFSLLRHNDMVCFNIDNKIKNWVKKDVLYYFNVCGKRDILNSYLVAGGVLFFKKNKRTLAFLKEWRKIMYDNSNLLLDVPTKEISKENIEFIEHRHDQSILTLLLLKSKDLRVKYIWENFESPAISGQAIYAARSKSMIQDKIKPRVLKYAIRHYLMYPTRKHLSNFKKYF